MSTASLSDNVYHMTVFYFAFEMPYAITTSDRPILIFYNRSDTDYLYVYVPITDIQNRYLFTVIK